MTGPPRRPAPAEPRRRTIGRNLRGWLALDGRQKRLLAEAMLVMAFASAAIILLPFRRVARLAGARLERPLAAEAASGAVREVRWAVAIAGQAVPWRAVCFQHGLTAHLMLRRRNIASTLYYGAARSGTEGLKAHVWVRAGDEDVSGCDEAPLYQLLATFPAEPGEGVRSGKA